MLELSRLFCYQHPENSCDDSRQLLQEHSTGLFQSYQTSHAYHGECFVKQ